MSMLKPAADPRAARWLTGTLFAILVVAGWGPGFGWGLWLDETFTAWQVDAGWRAIASTKLVNPGQSALFAYLEAPFFFPHPGVMEVALRVPALAGALLSCLFLYRLAESQVGKGAGVLASIVFVGSPAVVEYVSQARPYTLAMAACLASLWGLLRWLETGARRHGWLFSISVASILYLHLLFVLFLPVLGIVVFQRARRAPPLPWRNLAVWLAVAASLLLPLFPLARSFARQSAGLSDVSQAPLPDLARGTVATLPGLILLALVAVAILSFRARRPVFDALRAPETAPTVRLLLFWLLVPPLALAAISYIVGQDVMLTRYFFYTAAAQGLMVALLLRDFPPKFARLTLFAGFLLLAVLNLAHRSVADGPDSWRAPIRALRALDPEGAAPVFLQAGHPMSNAMDWEGGIAAHSFLYSQLSAYPIPNRVYPLPYGLDEVAQSYVRHLADGELSRAPLIFFAGIRDLPIERWVCSFFESRGYTCRDAVATGLSLLVMRRPG